MILPGATDQTVHMFCQDSTTGLAETGLAFGSAGVACYYVRPGAAAVQIALVTQTVTGAHTDGGFVEIGAATAPGVYRLDLPDAAVAVGAAEAVVSLAFTGVFCDPLRIDLEANTYQAEVAMHDDDLAGTPADRYTVVWFKNGEPITSGITLPLIQVVKVADGTDLVAEAAMTQVGALGYYRYFETTAANRIVDGTAYVAKASATIGGSVRVWYWPVGRDT